MRLPDTVRERFRQHGKRGGRLRSRRMAPAVRRTVARRAALRRWIRARFGAPSFAMLGLPGGDLVDRGLDDLAAGLETVDSLLVSLAGPRLLREGVPLPTLRFPDASLRLFRRLETTEGDLAHARYLARLERMTSFADACAASRVDRPRRAR